MRRHRRLVLMDRIIPFLAAFVGLVALAGAVLVQVNADARTRLMAEQVAALRGEIARFAAEVEAAAGEPAGPDEGTVAALLALQERMDMLETQWAERPLTTASTAGGQGTFSAGPDGTPTAVDPSWPTDNCIPIGTRFMVSTGDELAICESPVVVKVSAVTGDNVMVDGAGVIYTTASKPIPGSNCALTVFDASAEGFAEMRVSCN